MIGSTRQVRIWACAEPVSMRKGFDGLYGAARQLIGRDPLDGDMFLFVARNRRQARVLHWDGTGLVLYAKRLERGRFNAPWEGDRSRPWCLTPTELALFLEGSRLVGHFEVSPPTLRLRR
ncbi:MAG: IS66 family insertion sequence element accessory protein TnpB [Candidatus Sericytochromatia bacterium]|nr:IS66 family insertion sequence element accessory protein TnpB [Candidatus Tanganyikabacteria bacterium]